jgi:hypothetical protein
MTHSHACLVTSLLLLTSCGIGGKGDDTGSAAAVGPGACYIESDLGDSVDEVDDSAICYTFSGLIWTEDKAIDYCESQVNAGATMEWRADENCPGGYDGFCDDIALIPGFDFEAYFYGMTVEVGKAACDIMGGNWSE